MKTSRFSRCAISLLAVTLTVTASMLFVLAGSAAAKGKPGGGGGGDPAPVNPAFVYADPADGGLFLTTSDGADPIRVTNPPRRFVDSDPVFSPDLDGDPDNGYQGTIAFLRRDTDTADAFLFVVQPDGSGETLVYDFGGGIDLSLTWSPDGKSIVSVVDFNIWFIDVLTGGVEKYALENKGWFASFSADQDLETEGYQGFLTFTQSGRLGDIDGGGDGADIVLLETNIDSNGAKTFGALTVLDRQYHQEEPRWSPNDLSIVFTEERPVDAHNSQTDVCVLDLKIVNGQPQIIAAECLVENIGTWPLGYTWSPDGLRIACELWLSGNGRSSSSEIVHIRVDGSENGVPTIVTSTSRIDELSPDWNPAWINEIDLVP